MPPAHADRLPRYQELRRAGFPLNSRLVQTLSKRDLLDGARRLGLLRAGAIELETEDESAVLMDYCLHDIRRRGKNAIDRFLAQSPPPAGSDERILLEAKRRSWFTLIQVEAAEARTGVQARDLLRDESVFVTDVGFSRSGQLGQVMATRLMDADGIVMTTGAPLPVGVLWPAQRDALLDGLKARLPGADFRHPTPAQASDLAAAVIRGCLDRGAAGRVSYIDHSGR
jgi:hypothetical protein